MRLLVAGALLAAACAGAPADSSRTVAAADTARTGGRTEVAVGYGTLRQDDATVALRSGPLQVKVTPLAEGMLRLLAPDTYERLRALRESRDAEARAALVREPSFFLVSFFSLQPDVAFNPEDVQLVYQSRLLRPQVISTVTTGWGRQRLRQQETQSAVYVFDGPIEWDQPFTLRYGVQESTGWSEIIPRLEAERARIVTRSGV